MKALVKNGATSNLVRVRILDASKTDGSGLTGLVYGTTGLVIDLIADNGAAGGAAAFHYKSAATASIQDIGTSGSTCGTYAAPSASNCRFAPVDATNFPGLYELQFLDACFAVSGAKRLIGEVKGPTNCTPTTFEIQLTAVDVDDGVAMGLTRIDATLASQPATNYLTNQLAMLRQQAGLTLFTFKMVLSSDHLTAATGKSPACSFSINGGAYVAATNTPATELAYGYYTLAITAAEVAGANTLAFRATATSSDAVESAVILRGGV